MKLKSTIEAEELFYPKSRKFNSGYVDVGDGHQLYFYEFGNPEGPPVLLVHGGPGQGVVEGSGYTRAHDPTFFRMIALDQRGCGQSIPHFADDPKGAIHKNDPFSLAKDIETVRKFLGIEKWHLYGGSWGSCLALLYAAKYPKEVLSLTMSAIWLHTPREIDWYINYMGLFQPEAEAELLKQLPKTVRPFDRLPFLYRAIMSPNEAYSLKISEAQGRFEDICIMFQPQESDKQPKRTAAEKRVEKRMMISLGALEVYFMKKHPLKEGWYRTATILKALNSIKDIHIIQGRYDIVCPPVMAYELHKLLPKSKLTIAQFGGHTMREPHMLSAVIHANNRLKHKSQ